MGLSPGFGKITNYAGKVGGTFAEGAVRGATSSALTQGIGVATGLQDSFSFTSVAAAGVGSGVSNSLFAQGAGNFVSGTASSIANAATRSALSGSSFGDNIVAAIPDVIGSTLGNGIASQITAGVNRIRAGIEAGDPAAIGLITGSFDEGTPVSATPASTESPVFDFLLNLDSVEEFVLADILAEDPYANERIAPPLEGFGNTLADDLRFRLGLAQVQEIGLIAAAREEAASVTGSSLLDSGLGGVGNLLNVTYTVLSDVSDAIGTLG